MEQASEKKFPHNAEDYELYEEVGEGVSATVYRALCVPLNEIVAIKVLDLEKCNNDLDGIRREVQTMILIDHPNLLRAHCSFATGHNLWVVMPYVAGGSCLHIIKSAYPEGFEEPVIATLLREVLKALVYLHAHGHIHRDVKAGNILVDSNGAVKLADFGVAACMYDTGDRQRSRNTFVGTPCWMAPEVMQQVHGYDFKADIWSFGITALELAHGHAPFSKYPPMKVLLMTLQNAPPGLDYERDKKFSRSFREIVAACLVKDPKKRPTSEKLLKNSFFKHARSKEYLARTMLGGLSPLGERFKMLKVKEADILVQNKAMYEDKEQLSQQEYIRGISAWNFNLEDLKNQAALIPDDLILNSEETSVSGRHADGQDDGSPVVGMYLERTNHSKAASQSEDELSDIHNLESSLAAFPMKPLEALKTCFDFSEDDIGGGADSEQQSQQQSFTSCVDQEAAMYAGGDSGRVGSISHSGIAGHRNFSSGQLIPDNVLSPKRFMGDGDREYLQPRHLRERNYSGPLQYRPKKDFSSSIAGEDASQGAVVERKGRFKVTSADMSAKGPINFFSPISGGSTNSRMASSAASSFLQSLRFILQQNTKQREELLKMIKFVEETSGNSAELTEASMFDLSQVRISLILHSATLNQFQNVRVGSLVEEVQRVKTKNVQLERRLNSMPRQDDRTRE
ncbi:serine/threonine-protein kinase BLUS1-like isoform X2 [Sesamum indicum]|uniref:Serine/threonine-protein kinase BLUS1-like isoform X2 n=1 Tax=Sesamum indicum TaxID=4182 RepID=A0A6I9TKB8_SESIN|nr:serine/threonine-protein kinase BLUS1-like isoform X2 [Sesamum indicum]